MDGEGNRTTYEYNGANLLSVLIDPAGEREQYQYDEEGRLCKKLDRNGTETAFTYNLYGNLLSRRAKELSEVYEYTTEGLLKSAIAGGMRYSYAYDAMGRLTEKRASGRTLLSFAYDKNGNLWKQRDVTGKETEYRYTINDEIKEIWDDGRLLTEYNYYEDGTIKSLKNGESLYTEYAYDKDKNLTGLRSILAGEVLVNNQYRYDGNGNRTGKQQLHGETSYTYDSLNRLTRVQYPQSFEELTYDRAGNRTRRLSPRGEEFYQYDSRNRLTSHTINDVTEAYRYDNAGNLLKDGKNQYTYDAFNRTSRVETFDGNIQINRYDAEGLRYEMEENGNLVQFIFRGAEVVAEESREEIRRYIRSDVLLASDAESARTYYHYASDELGSITHVTEGEEVLNQYEYDAWGNVTENQEKVENRFQFNGQQYDPVSQQYYLRARYYNPVIGRFTQEDSYRGDGLNLYAYCANNPVYYVDPSGNICETAAKTIMDKVAQGQAGKNEKKKLAAYLRNKQNKSGLTIEEQKLLNIFSYKKGSQVGASKLQKRATEINNARGDWESRNGTTVVMKAIDNETGAEVYLVSTNAPNKSVPKVLQDVLNENELYIGGKGHAEQTIMQSKGERYTIIEGGTSRNICVDICKPLLENDGLTIGGTEFKGNSDKTRYREFWRE